MGSPASGLGPGKLEQVLGRTRINVYLEPGMYTSGNGKLNKGLFCKDLVLLWVGKLASLPGLNIMITRIGCCGSWEVQGGWTDKVPILKMPNFPRTILITIQFYLICLPFLDKSSL